MISPGTFHRLMARWLFPGDAPPIENGVIEIVDGQIAAIEKFHGAADSMTLDLGNVALIPGLINCHAHLEFSDLEAPIEPPRPFAQWIRNLLEHRHKRRAGLRELVRAGLTESAAAGTCLVGEIATADWSPDWLVPDDPHVVAFRECIGLVPEQITGQVQLARQHLESCRSAQSVGLPVIGGVSPHAPYSVMPELFERLIALAHEFHAPLCMHLAETPAELEFLKYGRGELHDLLVQFGVCREDILPRGIRPIDYLRRLTDLDCALIAHGNYLDEAEQRFLTEHPQITLVYCPRTHQFFGHSEHPWLRLLESGASVALGTDGRSSNPDYSLWGEVQFLDRATGGRLRPTLLRLATLNGARALRMDGRMGTLSLEKLADFCVIALPDGAATDPWLALFDPRSTVVGRWHRAGFNSDASR